MSNSLDLDRARHFQTGQNVRLDLVPNCLKRLSADDMSGKVLMQKVKYNEINHWHSVKISGGLLKRAKKNVIRDFL